MEIEEEVKTAAHLLIGKVNEDDDNYAESAMSEGAELFHSNLFRLQIGELLSEVKVNYSKMKTLNEKLHQFKDAIDKIPEQKITSVKIKDWKVPIHEENIQKLSNFVFQKPENIYMIGSYLLHTMCAPFHNIDLVVHIPKNCIREKDIKNNLYSDKRLIYLTVIANALANNPNYSAENLYWKAFNGDLGKPILCYKLKLGKSKEYEIRIHTSISEKTFKLSKLLPSRNNLHSETQNNNNSNNNNNNNKKVQMSSNQESTLPPTPYYNNQILEDIYYLQHLQLLHEYLNLSPNLIDTILLFKIWLKQRQLDQRVDGFSGFHFAMIIIALFKQRKLNKTMSSFQLFKITLTFLSTNTDLITKGMTLCDNNNDDDDDDGEDSNNNGYQYFSEFEGKFEVILIDASGRLNITSRVSRSCFEELQYEAKLSVAYLQESDLSSSENFESLFLRSVPFYLKFSNFLQITKLPSPPPLSSSELSTEYRFEDRDWRSNVVLKICDTLKRGLSLRSHLIATRRSLPSTWSINCAQSEYADDLVVGIILKDIEHSHKIVEPGPSAEDEDASASFREFWGEKAELWRFKDGSILEAVRWDLPFEKRHLVPRSIVLHLLAHHFGIDPNDGVSYFVDQLDFMLESKDTFKKLASPSSSSQKNNNKKRSLDEEIAYNAPLNYKLVSVYDELSRVIMALEMPLRIKAIMGAHSSFSYSSPITITPHSLLLKKKKQSDISTSLYIEPITLVLNLESSSKWPDDLHAVRALKGSFYIHLGEQLEVSKQGNRHDLQTHPTHDYLDVYYKGFAFRLFIRLKKEIQLVEKVEGKIAADLLRSQYLRKPQHTLFMKNFHHRYPIFGPTARLAKRWFHSQLLSNCITEEAIELIVAYLFVHPKPFSVPTSHFDAFLRFLHFVSTFDFEKSPIIINLPSHHATDDDDDNNRSSSSSENSLNALQLQEIHKKFQYKRSSPVWGAPIYIASPFDYDSNFWTSQKPTRMFLQRIVDFAKHSLDLIQSHFVSSSSSSSSPSSSLNRICRSKYWKKLFTTTYGDYDVLLKINPFVVPFHRYRIINRITDRYFCHGDTTTDDAAKRPTSASPAVPSLSLQIPKYRNLQQGSSIKPYVGLSAVSLLVDELQEHFKNVGLFFYGESGEDVIAIIWKPAAFLPKPMRPLDLSYSLPLSDQNAVSTKGKKTTKFVIKNIFEIISDIKLLGEGVIDDVVFVSTSNKL